MQAMSVVGRQTHVKGALRVELCGCFCNILRAAQVKNHVLVEVFELGTWLRYSDAVK